MSMQSLFSHCYGMQDGTAPASSTLALSATNTHLVYTFIAQAPFTLSKVRAFLSAVNGTLAATNLVCELWSFPNGAQTTTTMGTLLESRNTVTAVPTGAGVVEFTGFTSTLTLGQQYGLRFKNANGTPTANFPTFRFATGLPNQLTGSNVAGHFKKHTTDGGSTWTGLVIGIGGFRLEFSDGSFYGAPFDQGAVTVVGDGVFSTSELGATFTSPADVFLRISRVGVRLTVTGTPTGVPRFCIYDASNTLIATTANVAQYFTAQYAVGVFASPVVLSPNTQYTVTLGETTQSDTSANRFNLFEYFVENDVNSQALLPFGGWSKAQFDGTSWTMTPTRAPIIWMIGDTTDFFDPAGSGGVLLNPALNGL
jgi:hypothetical protein